jgi:hypothetical protein
MNKNTIENQYYKRKIDKKLKKNLYHSKNLTNIAKKL